MRAHQTRGQAIIHSTVRINARGFHQEAARRCMMDAFAGLGLLNRTDNGFANAPEADAYLVHGVRRRSPATSTIRNGALWWLWGNLASAVREGTPRRKQAFGHSGGIFDSFYATEEPSVNSSSACTVMDC